MNKNSLLRATRKGTKRIPVGLGLALALIFLNYNVSANEVLLGTANDFAVLAGSAITSTGATVINGGNVGESPGSAISGFPPAVIIPPFTTDLGNAVALQGQRDLTTAYNNAVGLPGVPLTGDLGGRTLTPGVYSFSSSAQLTGTLTLNDQGNPDAIFVFQIGKTLATAANSSVVTINDPSIPGISVFWQVGSSATLGAGTDFEGNILANTSITAGNDATIDGRLLAENGAITLDDDTITAPPPEVPATGGTGVSDTGNTLLLLGSTLATVFAFGRKSSAVLLSH